MNDQVDVLTWIFKNRDNLPACNNAQGAFIINPEIIPGLHIERLIEAGFEINFYHCLPGEVSMNITDRRFRRLTGRMNIKQRLIELKPLAATYA